VSTTADVLALIQSILAADPGLAARVDAACATAGRGNADRMCVGIQISASIAKFNGDPQPGDAPVEVINIGEERSCL
jgi:hypothetical protein